MVVAPESVDHTRPVQILVIEDNEFLRNCYERYLSKFGGMSPAWVVSTAEQALAILRGEDLPDLVVSDLSLPDASGADVVTKLRAEAPSIPILVVSGHHERHHIREAFEAGASGYVLKGETRDIIDGVRAVLEGNQFLSRSIRDADSGSSIL